MCESIDREVTSAGGGGDWGTPAQGEVEGGQASYEGTGGVICPRVECRMSLEFGIGRAI